MLAVSRDQESNRLAEAVVRQYCREVHELTYIEHGADNLILLANRAYVFRFPRNETAVQRLYYETALLQKLAGKLQAVAVPQVQHLNRTPAYMVSPYMQGDHLTVSQLLALPTTDQEQIGQTLATFAVELNQATTGEQVSRLRRESYVEALEEPWAPYFARLFAAGAPLDPHLAPIAQHYYQLWQEYAAQERTTYAIHDDLHPVNLLFTGSKLTGILDFGDANSGSIESEFRWLYAMGPTILDAAVSTYQQLTGQALNVDHIRVWAIMHELSTFTDRLARKDIESFPFLRAQANLRAWLPDFPG